jgi:hypothetical protein
MTGVEGASMAGVEGAGCRLLKREMALSNGGNDWD